MLQKPAKSTIVWLFRHWKAFSLQAVINTFIGLLMVGSDLAFVWATKQAIDVATGAQERFSLTTAIVMLCALIVLQISLSVGSRWVAAMLGVRSENAMRRRLFSHLLEGSWQQLRRFHTGALVNRVEQDVSTVVSFLTDSLPSLITTIVKFVGAFVFLYVMNRELAIVIALVIPFFVVCSRLYVRKLRRISHAIRERESSIQSIIQESLQHALVVKTLGGERRLAGHLSEAQGKLHGEVLSRTRYSSISSAILNAGFAAGYMAAFIWGVRGLEAGAVTYGAMTAFIQLVGQIQGPVRTLSRFVPVFISAFTAADRLMELEHIEPEAAENSDFDGKEPEALGLRLSEVSFAYEATPLRPSRTVIDRLSFDFPPGSTTAIVGETGAGKTTIIRLILALAAPKEGKIEAYAPGGAAKSVSSATRRSFSYVPQGNTLLSGSIRFNLQLAAPAATEHDMEEALREACADFVLRLPRGLDTTLGELGNGLSEGQAQRIAIARALLRRSPILLLDEATSALDAETERRVLRNIVEKQRGRTIIVVTHRPEVLQYCTQTLRLERTK